MPVQPEQNRSGRTRPLSVGKILQMTLAVAGLILFFLLAREVNFSDIPAASLETLPGFIAAILGLLVVNYTFDTASWWIVCGEKRPTLWQLMLIRLRCEAITNVIPGGGFIGEPMKVSFLTGYGMSRAEAGASFILSKFVLIIAQVLYVFLGLALSYKVINQVSESVFGVSDFAAYVLAGALMIMLIILGLSAGMIWFQPLNNRFSFSEKEGRLHRWWNIILAELREIEMLAASEFRHHRYRLILAIVFSFIAWSLNGVELYLIVRWLGINASFVQIYSIDAVSVVIRMVVFVIPIGMGGQDWTIRGLVTAHGFADPATMAARMVVLKRGREFMVIGVGLLLLLFMSKPSRRGEALPEAP